MLEPPFAHLRSNTTASFQQGSNRVDGLTEDVAMPSDEGLDCVRQVTDMTQMTMY
jgi:hypothetical protein